jgi:tRNA threonylcarbamoyladenosine biosynthesis protein TsaB
MAATAGELQRSGRSAVKVLALSTSTPRGSAALVRDGEVLATVVYVDLQGHAERIFEAIDAVLAQAGETRGAIDALACDVGPGSFTGVRVGVASAKGIALGLGLPLVGVVSLEAMAAAAFAAGEAGALDVVLAAIDAKKGEVFAAAYDIRGATLLAPCVRAQGSQAFAMAAPPGGRVVVAGEVAAEIALPAGARLARGVALDLPDAGWVGRLAAPRVGAPGEAGVDAVEPLYVRPPDAVPALRPQTPGSE